MIDQNQPNTDKFDRLNEKLVPQGLAPGLMKELFEDNGLKPRVFKKQEQDLPIPQLDFDNLHALSAFPHRV